MIKDIELMFEGAHGSDLVERIKSTEGLSISPEATAVLSNLTGSPVGVRAIRVVHMKDDLGLVKTLDGTSPPLSESYLKANALGWKWCPADSAALFLLSCGAPPATLHFASEPVNGMLFFIEGSHLHCYSDILSERRSIDSYLVFGV